VGFFAQHVAPSNVDFLYFSFVTLTTLGYGDFTPATDIGKVMVTFEALIGQVFLVTLVARLVSMYGVARHPRQDPN
jgi:voltage-gated potassium channel Kch